MTYAKIFYHGNCLDGATSAALATLFVKERYPSASIEYVPLLHGPNFAYDPEWFTADLHMVLDFPYPGRTQGDLIWIDHHSSSFASSELRNTYEELKASEPLYWNPQAPSNAGLMLNILRKDFNLDPGDQWSAIIDWVDMIDSGSFTTPEIAVELLDPAVAFAQLLSSNPELSPDFIKDLSSNPDFDALAKEHTWSRLINRVRQDNWTLLEEVKEIIKIEGGVAYVDLTHRTVDHYNPFMPYYIAPDVKYAVALLRQSNKIKISVGENPWSQLKFHQKIDISALCEQYGGGGHIGVGAVSLLLEEHTRAEEIALKIFNEIKNFLLLHATSSLKHIP